MTEDSETFSLSKKEMAVLANVTEGTNRFAVSLYRALSSNRLGNVLVSPLSVQMILALAYTGAKEETAKQLATLLALPDKIDDIYEGYHSLINFLQAPVLTLVNRMFVEKTAGVKKDFQKNADIFFYSPAEGLDFSTASEKSREYINSWVEDKTNKKITNLIPRGIITTNTRLVLVNAIHFKADWSEKFREDVTKEEPFHVSKTETVQVKMMHTKNKFLFSHDKQLKGKMLQLDYEERNFRMIVILPDDIEGLAELEAKLEKVDLSEKIRYMYKRTVTVAMPKFKMEETMELNEVLKSLGAEAMFDVGKANFSGLSDKPLFVSNVVQKAVVEVNENGTEAKAATALNVALKNLVIGYPQLTFKADHPFVFIIMNKNHILFIGRMILPLQGKR